MYTIQFGQRAHFLSDAAAQEVLTAIREHQPFVTIPIDLAADGGEEYIVTLNVTTIVALIQHRAEVNGNPQVAPHSRPHLALVE